MVLLIVAEGLVREPVVHDTLHLQPVRVARRGSHGVGPARDADRLPDVPLLDVPVKRPGRAAQVRRELPLSAELARQLWTTRPASGKGPIFATRTGTRLMDRNVRRVLHTATEGTSLDWVTFHTFRHTCASILFEQGKNIAQVSKWLGHADPAFTLRTYVHLLDAGLGEAIDLYQVNTGSTQRLQTDANEVSGRKPDSASQSENVEPLQEAATA
jgi:hypothetical protein